MPELYLQRNKDTLLVRLGELSTTVPLTDVLPHPKLWKQIYDDAATYGRELFEQTFREETIRTMLTEMRTGERLVLIVDDLLVAQIPWEYLRDSNNKLLASRLTLVRFAPSSRPITVSPPIGPLEIIAIPSDPIDATIHLNVEQEWRDLVKIVTNQSPARALTLKRLRPPTRSTLGHTLSQQGSSIVHFMGHGMLHNGKACLVFEDARGRQQMVDAADLTDVLNAQVFLVILNSCLSATVATTEFGNLAQALVKRGVPYALGMQYSIPDEAAQVFSQALLRGMLQGNTLEEAVMQTRRALQDQGQASHPEWLAGLPVLYTSQREHLTPPFILANGQPTVFPEPGQLEKSIDLTELPPADHFLGRANALEELLDPLLSPGAHGFVMVHGLGGIGKTSLTHVVAERVSWYYEDRVLAISFETFATLDANNQRVINEGFLDRFYTRLLRFYTLDPAAYSTVAEQQQAILQRRTHQRSLLLLDNIETLLDALAHPMAQECAAFLVRLKDGDGVILLTSRQLAPADWGVDMLITLDGLSAEFGAELFQAFLPLDRQKLASHEARLTLSQRVQGHPLSIRLLAGPFADETTLDLATFLSTINNELATAERAIPGSLADPERQKTLYACIDYSARRLTTAQRIVLDMVSLFQAPFPAEFASIVIDDTEQTPLHLHHLVRLGLLNTITRTFADGELIRFELHSMVRWYIELNRPNLPKDVKERYGALYAHLVSDAAQPTSDYERSERVRILVRQSFVDCEAALASLEPKTSSILAYYLARLYHRLGQIRRTLDLYEHSLQTSQTLGDVYLIAATQNAMADVLVQQGKIQEALALYARSLQTVQTLGDEHGISATQHAIADVLVQQNKTQEALDLYAHSLQTVQTLGYVRDIAIIQNSIADVLVQQGKIREALALYARSLQTSQTLGDVHLIAATQDAIADVLVQQGKIQEALDLYTQSLQAEQALGDVRAIAITQNSIANILIQQGKIQEALDLYTQSLQAKQTLGDVREIAVTQNSIANILIQQGKIQEALDLYTQSLQTSQTLGDVRGIAITQRAMAGVLVRQGKIQEALDLYTHFLKTSQTLGDVREIAVTQNAMADVLVRQGKIQEALDLYIHSLQTSQTLGYVREVAATQHAMAHVLMQQNKIQEALDLYTCSLQTYQALGYVHEIAVTQNSIANVLVQQGKIQEALDLYAHSLKTKQTLGDMCEIAITQNSMADVLVQQGKFQEALDLYAHSLQTYQTLGYVREIAVTQNSMADVLVQQGKIREALDLYAHSLQTSQTLGDVREIAINQHAVADVLVQQGKIREALDLYAHSLQTYQTLRNVRSIATTQTNMGQILMQLGEHQQALSLVWDAYKHITTLHFNSDIQAIQQIVTQFKGQILGSERFDQIWQVAVGEPQPEWLSAIPLSKDSTGEVVSVSDEDQLPFPPELIKQSVRALLGGPQEKMASMQELTGQLAQTEDEQLRMLLRTIQLALFSTDLSVLDHNLNGVYRKAWKTIVAIVEAGGVDPQLFETIANNTLAVLGPAREQCNQWRSNLADIRNLATLQGNRNMVDLLDAIAGLLDTDGKPEGLGTSLQGIYTKTWQTIVARLV